MESTELMQLLATRRTYRKFHESRPVPQEVVDEILEAARLASSAANRQPLRFIVVRDQALVDQVFPLLKWAASLPPELGVPRPGERPPLYVATLIDTQVPSAFAQTDAGLALSNMTLSAWAHGVGSCIIASVNHKGLRALLDIEESLQIHTVTAFGYPAVASRVVDPQDGGLSYYLDEAGDYCVPKRLIEDVVRIC